MENIGWWIAGIIAAICITGIVRIAQDRAICYYNIWDFLAGTIPVVAVGVGAFMAFNCTGYTVQKNGIMTLWIAGPLALVYHATLAIVFNHRTWFDAPIMFTCRLIGIVTTVGGLILSWVIGGTRKQSYESDGEYVMRAVSAKAKSFAVGYGVGWVACWLINGAEVKEARASEIEYTPYRRVKDVRWSAEKANEQERRRLQ